MAKTTTDATAGTAVEELKNTTALVAGVDAEALSLMADDDNEDNIDMRDIAIPYIQILQSLSPQLDKQAPEYIKGAEAGMFINTATGELYDGDTGIGLIPIKFSRRITEWVPRSKGGGLVNDYGEDESIVKQTTRSENSGKDVLPNGNEIITAGTFYVLVVDVRTLEVVGRGLVSLTSTQYKKVKRWNAMITNFQLPRPNGGKFTPKMYACVYHATAVPESNDQGRWSGWKFTPLENEDGSRKLTVQLDGGAEIYKSAQDFRAQIDAGDVKIAEPEAGGAGGGPRGDMDEEIPF